MQGKSIDSATRNLTLCFSNVTFRNVRTQKSLPPALSLETQVYLVQETESPCATFSVLHYRIPFMSCLQKGIIVIIYSVFHEECAVLLTLFVKKGVVPAGS